MVQAEAVKTRSRWGETTHFSEQREVCMGDLEPRHDLRKCLFDLEHIRITPNVTEALKPLEHGGLFCGRQLAQRCLGCVFCGWDVLCMCRGHLVCVMGAVCGYVMCCVCVCVSGSVPGV